MFWAFLSFELFLWLFAIAFLVIVISLSRHKDDTAVGLTILLAILLIGFTDFNWSSLRPYWLYIIGGYLIIGILWAFFKWFLFLADLRKDVLAFFDNETNKAKMSNRPVPPRQEMIDLYRKNYEFRAFGDYVRYKLNYNENGTIQNNVIPDVTKYKADLCLVFALWPASFVDYLFGRVLGDIWNFIFSRTKKLFEAIANKMMGDI